MKRDELRKIPIKNYVILGVVIIVTMLILYYFYLWVDVYKESKINIPIMDKYMTVINYNELDNYLVENPNTIVYVSVLEDEGIRNFEQKFKKYINDNELSNKMLYLDLTEVSKDINLYSELINKYRVKKKSIGDVPCLLLFKEGKLDKIYPINEKKYNLNEITFFLEQEDVIDD